MKRSPYLLLRLVYGLAFGLLLVTGCAHTLCIKVIDATNGKSVVGVSTLWHEHVYDLLTGRHQTGPTNLPPSSDLGLITIPNVHKHWANTLVFSKPGYRTVYGNYIDSKVWLSIRMHTFSDNENVLDDPMTQAALTNGCFVVPMPNDGTKIAK